MKKLMKIFVRKTGSIPGNSADNIAQDSVEQKNEYPVIQESDQYDIDNFFSKSPVSFRREKVIKYLSVMADKFCDPSYSASSNQIIYEYHRNPVYFLMVDEFRQNKIIETILRIININHHAAFYPTNRQKHIRLTAISALNRFNMSLDQKLFAAEELRRMICTSTNAIATAGIEAFSEMPGIFAAVDEQGQRNIYHRIIYILGKDNTQLTARTVTALEKMTGFPLFESFLNDIVTVLSEYSFDLFRIWTIEGELRPEITRKNSRFEIFHLFHKLKIPVSPEWIRIITDDVINGLHVCFMEVSEEESMKRFVWAFDEILTEEKRQEVISVLINKMNDIAGRSGNYKLVTALSLIREYINENQTEKIILLIKYALSMSNYSVMETAVSGGQYYVTRISSDDEIKNILITLCSWDHTFSHSRPMNVIISLAESLHLLSDDWQVTLLSRLAREGIFGNTRESCWPDLQTPFTALKACLRSVRYHQKIKFLDEIIPFLHEKFDNAYKDRYQIAEVKNKIIDLLISFLDGMNHEQKQHVINSIIVKKYPERFNMSEDYDNNFNSVLLSVCADCAGKYEARLAVTGLFNLFRENTKTDIFERKTLPEYIFPMAGI